jgi:hypothetical protein
MKKMKLSIRVGQTQIQKAAFSAGIARCFPELTRLRSENVKNVVISSSQFIGDT